MKKIILVILFFLYSGLAYSQVPPYYQGPSLNSVSNIGASAYEVAEAYCRFKVDNAYPYPLTYSPLEMSAAGANNHQTFKCYYERDSDGAIRDYGGGTAVYNFCPAATDDFEEYDLPGCQCSVPAAGQGGS